MALISVNGVDLPAPSSFQVDLQDIVNAGRNANGDLIAEFINAKDKIEMSWAFLTADQLKTILTAISPFFFSATYLNPKTNTTRTATFYKGDRTIPLLDYNNGVARYTNFAVNFIEK